MIMSRNSELEQLVETSKWNIAVDKSQIYKSYKCDGITLSK